MSKGQPGGQDGWHQERLNVGVNIPWPRNRDKPSLQEVGGIQKLEMHKGKLYTDCRDHSVASLNLAFKERLFLGKSMKIIFKKESKIRIRRGTL